MFQVRRKEQFPSSIRYPHPYNKGIALIAMGFLFLNLVGLNRSPVVWMDEVTLNDPAKELALHGRMVSSVFSGHNGFEEAYYWQPPGQPLVMALVYKVFGFGIWQTRIPGVLFGSGTLVVLYLLATVFFRSHKGALLSAVILGLDPRFIESARSGRMDTQTLFFALLGALLFIVVKQRNYENHDSRRTIFLAGICLGLAGLSHPLAIVWLVSFGVIAILSRERAQLGIFMWVAAIAATPTVLWILSVAAAGDLQLLRHQFLEHGFSRLSVGVVSIGRILEEVLRYAVEYKYAPGLLALYVFGVTWAWMHRDRFRCNPSWFAILFLVPAIFNALFMSKKVGFYFLYPVTMLAIVAGEMTSGLWEGTLVPNRSRITIRLLQSVLILVLANVLVAGILGRYATLAYQWRARDYQPVVRALAEILPYDSIVWGPPDIWYAVEHVGSSLRVRGEPDPDIHDFLVTKVSSNIEFPEQVSHVSEFGAALPPVFGAVHLPSADYRMRVWAWTQH